MPFTTPKPQSASELTIDCTYCGAKAGTWCTTRKGKPTSTVHCERYEHWYVEHVTRPALEALKQKKQAKENVRKLESQLPIGDILPVDEETYNTGYGITKLYVYMYDRVLHSTDKAYLFAIDDKTFWVPKALIKDADTGLRAIYVVARKSFNSIESTN